MASFLKRISAEKCNRITETHYAESEEPQTSCFFFRRIFLLGSIFSVCEISGIPAKKNSTFKRSKFREVLLNSKGHQSHLNHRFLLNSLAQTPRNPGIPWDSTLGSDLFLLDFRGP